MLSSLLLPCLTLSPPGPSVHYSDIQFTTKSASYFEFLFLSSPWTCTLTHCAGHSETPAVHLCSSVVEKMKGLLLSQFKQTMIFKDLPEQLHLCWWWGWQSTGVGIKEEVYGAFPWPGWKSGPWPQIKLKKKGGHIYEFQSGFQHIPQRTQRKDGKKGGASSKPHPKPAETRNKMSLSLQY